MKKTFKIIGYALTILILIITLILIGISIVSFTTKKPVKVFGYGYGVVESKSMQPMILVGDFVLIQDVDYDTLEIGDVIAFTAYDGSGMTIIHQIIDENEDGYITKGLFNPDPDPGEVNPERLVGKVVAYGGHEIGVVIVQSREFLVTFVIIIIAFIFIIQLFGFFKQLREKEKARLDEELKAYSEKLKAEILEEELQNQDQETKNN